MKKYRSPKIISEIGCNHKGDLGIAKELIKLSRECGATVAKFQKRDNLTLLTSEQYDSPHPNPMNSYGETYGMHREFLEFDVNQHVELMKFCDEIDIVYSTSVWEEVSARQIVEINPQLIKVPSACNNNYKMLEVLRDDYDGEIHISTGMTTQDEIEKIVSFFESNKQSNKKLVMYSCTSGYPVPFEDVCLLEITSLIEKYQHRVKNIGFSGHHLGIAIDNAAYVLGANWIERHFTKDRTWKGTDHAASLEPNGLRRLVRDLSATYKSLSYKESEVLPIEMVQRDKLKYRK